MKTVEIEKLLAADPLAVFAFKPTRQIDRDQFVPVYIRGIRRTIHGRWKFAEVKRATPEGSWRKEAGSFRPMEIITAADAEEIVKRNEEHRRQRAKQSIKMMCAAGRMRLHGYAAKAVDAGVAVDPDWINRMLDAREGRGIHWESLSFCETIAGYLWHIRALSMAGRKPSGGCDTLALCGAKAAWDVGAPVTKAILGMSTGGPAAPCSACVTVIKEAM